MKVVFLFLSRSSGSSGAISGDVSSDSTLVAGLTLRSLGTVSGDLQESKSISISSSIEMEWDGTDVTRSGTVEALGSGRTVSRQVSDSTTSLSSSNRQFRFGDEERRRDSRNSSWEVLDRRILHRSHLVVLHIHRQQLHRLRNRKVSFAIRCVRGAESDAHPPP